VLGAELLNERTGLVEHVAGLPSELVDDDLAAKQFDLLVVRTQLSVPRHDASFDSYRKKIVAGLLEELGNVPMVAKELPLILEIQTEEYWRDVNAPMLETVRRRIRELVKLIEVKRLPVVYTDFEDEIGTGTAIEVQGVGVGTDMDRFRLKARHFLKGHENQIAVLKLKRNEPLTPVDLAELENVFVGAGAQPGEIEQVRAGGGLGLFVGLERDAAKKAFEGFLAGKAPTADQIEFLNMIIDHLTERGAMEPKLLYESPFTDVNPHGIAGLFRQPEVEQVISILDQVRRRAAV
jgi:type I restriction enzyme, R subunit